MQKYHAMRVLQQQQNGSKMERKKKTIIKWVGHSKCCFFFADVI